MDQEAEKSLNEGKCCSSEAVNKVRKLWNRRMLIGIKDGRFHCLDKQGNIILQDAVEYHSTRRSSPSPMEERCLGIILIPRCYRSSCNVDCSIVLSTLTTSCEQSIKVVRI